MLNCVIFDNFQNIYVYFSVINGFRKELIENIFS